MDIHFSPTVHISLDLEDITGLSKAFFFQKAQIAISVNY